MRLVLYKVSLQSYVVEFTHGVKISQWGGGGGEKNVNVYSTLCSQGVTYPSPTQDQI